MSILVDTRWAAVAVVSFPIVACVSGVSWDANFVAGSAPLASHIVLITDAIAVPLGWAFDLRCTRRACRKRGRFRGSRGLGEDLGRGADEHERDKSQTSHVLKWVFFFS